MSAAVSGAGAERAVSTLSVPRGPGLGRQLVAATPTKPMSGERFQECLDIIRHSRRDFAKAIKARPNTVDLWATSKVSIPPSIARFLESEVRHRLRNPYPDPAVWRRRGRNVTPKGPDGLPLIGTESEPESDEE